MANSLVAPNPAIRHRHQRIRWASVYRACEQITEVLLYFVIVFSPWAFGTTQPWAVRVASIACYSMGLLLAGKQIIRWLVRIQPPRWDGDSTKDIEPADHSTAQQRQWLVAAMGAITFLLLAYCLISALNPRAYYDPSTHALHPTKCILWLPHSYDPIITWMLFGQHLAIACFFWSVRDWLLGKSRHDLAEEWAISARNMGDTDGQALSGLVGRPVPGSQSWIANDPIGSVRTPRPAVEYPQGSDHRHHHKLPGISLFPSRLKRLLWILSINGALLATEGIVQRLDGTKKLLWLVQPRINPSSEFLFGPYAYRSNAAQYLNLVWPVAVGFWLVLRKHRRQALLRSRHSIGSGSEVMLLPCIALMTAAPVVSSSRGGALVALAAWCACGLLIFWEFRRDHRWARLSVGAMFLAGLCLGGYLGWEKLSARMKTILDKDLSVQSRQVIYENAQAMADEHPWLGTGPGTFSTLYQYYRANSTQDWAVMAHNDWLETRITFGWIGTALIMAVILILAAKWFIPGGIPASGVLATSIAISIGGCFLHATFDFPFQILSILLLFTLLGSILFSSTRPHNIL